MSGVIKKMFVVLLLSIVNTPNHTKCVSLSNQKCKIQPTLINLHPNEYSQELHYYTRSNDEETKTCPINFNEKKQPVKCKISIFYLHSY